MIEFFIWMESYFIFTGGLIVGYAVGIYVGVGCGKRWVYRRMGLGRIK